MRVLGAIGVVALCVYATGLVHPPSLETVTRDISSTLGSGTYAVVGAFAFAETGAFIGLVAPGEIVVIFGGVSAGHGVISLVGLIGVVWACALAGDLTSYVLGRRLGREFLVRHGGALGVTEPRLAQVERFFAAHGGKTIIVGRFIGLIRVLAPFIAGASRMPARRFIPYTTVASGLWAATFCGLGYAFWESLDELLALTRQGTVVLGAAIAMGAVAVVLRRRRQTARG